MTLLRRVLEAAIEKRPNELRPPMLGYGGWMEPLGGGRTTGGQLEQMQAMGSVGWLFSAVDRIATAVSDSEWTLYRNSGNGEAEELTSHPLLSLWKRPNPFYTREELLEVSSQHFDLTGEMWWVLLRNAMGMPVEMWPVRPNRMRPVPHPQEYISGYVYTVGSQQIPLNREDVIFARRPNPVDPYRGIGVVQSILNELGTEQLSARWTKMFFHNSAEPGGIIEYDEGLSDADFDRLVSRWRQQHQGVSNAHRVAIIERGRWHDRKITQRDMQFEQLRKLNRDIILGAFGMPVHMLGVSETVNRANAEAAEYTFSRWVIRPRLKRIKAVINERLVPLFGDPSLTFDLTDPTPKNREFNLEEAERGYQSGFLTRNEARARLGEGKVAGGDEFLIAPEGREGASTPKGDTVSAREPTQRASGESNEELQPTGHPVPATSQEARCPQCGKLLGKNVGEGAELFCRRCSKTVLVGHR